MSRLTILAQQCRIIIRAAQVYARVYSPKAHSHQKGEALSYQSLPSKNVDGRCRP